MKIKNVYSLMWICIYAATSGVVHMHMHLESKKWKDVGDL